MRLLQRFTFSPAGIALLLAMPSSLAQAQTTTPDAGALLREAERSLQMPRSRPQPQVPPASQPMAEDAKAARVTVQSIHIEGAHLIPQAELQALVADRIGQSLTLAELEQTAQRIVEHYRAQGWHARVYLPQQDVTDGRVQLQVLEARYGGSHVVHQSERAHAASVQATVTQRLQIGRAHV